MTLILSRANGHRPGDWNPDDFNVLDDAHEVGEDYDVLDGKCVVGRIYRITASTGIWWWESFMPTRHKGYGDAPTREAAMTALRRHVRWRAEQPKT